MQRIGVIAAIATVGAWVVPSVGGAQSVGSMVVSDLANAGKDAVSVWTSPLHGNAHDWLTAAGVVAAAAAVSPLDDNVDRWIVANQHASEWSALKELREGGVAFSGKYITPAALGVYGAGLITHNQGLRDGVMGCAAAYASESIVRNYVLYYLIARTRPDSSRNGFDSPPAVQDAQYHFRFPGVSDWGRHATPAGHVANVAACASYLDTRFQFGAVGKTVVYALTAGVGFGRMLDRRHWTSDTMLGIALGYAVGREIGSRARGRLSAPNGAGHDDDLGVDPMPAIGSGPDGHGLSLTWTVRR